MSGTNLPRVGLGFDLHRLEEGRPCILGGIELPHPTGPAGHSDGDAVLHALTDGKLKWASLGDTYDEFYFPDGKRIDFPDSKQQFRDNLVAAFPEEEEAIDR